MLSLILFIIAGIFNAVMDVIKTRWKVSIFSNIKNKKLLAFCYPPIAQNNKYKDGDSTKGARFFGSTTFLVAFTDLWHTAKALMLILIGVGTVLYTTIFNPWIDAILLIVVFTTTFEIFYSKIFIKKVAK
jgi:hypothetical protein